MATFSARIVRFSIYGPLRDVAVPTLSNNLSYLHPYAMKYLLGAMITPLEELILALSKPMRSFVFATIGATCSVISNTGAEFLAIVQHAKLLHIVTRLLYYPYQYRMLLIEFGAILLALSQPHNAVSPMFW